MFAGDRPPTGARRLRTPLFILALFALAPALAACGGSNGSSSRSKPSSAQTPGLQGGTLSSRDLALVADRTSAKGTMRMSIEQTTKLGAQGTLPATGGGSFDTKARRGEMTLTIDASHLQGAGGAAGKLEQQMVFDGLTFYMRSPSFASVLPGGKTWMKVDLAKVGKDVGIDISSLLQGANQDPTQALQYLKAAGGSVRRVATETVRGASTTHYKATVEFSKVPDAAPADQRAAMRHSIQQVIKLTGTTQVPIDVWVGDDGLARRIVTAYASDAGGQRTETRQRIEMYDFGANVDVKIPAASDTFDASKLGDLLQGAGAGSFAEPG